MARENLKLGRNLRGEESLHNQRIADDSCLQIRKHCEELLDLYGRTEMTSPNWLVFHPWILMLAAVNRVKPRAILEERVIREVMDEAKPQVAVTLSHVGRVASKSRFISISVQGIPERLHLFKDGGKIFPPDGSGRALRRANVRDAFNYQPVVEMIASKFPVMPPTTS